MAKELIKSADEDQFELDEQSINEISNAEEFADVEITNEDIMDAVEAIDALADSVIEKADAEDKKVDADELLDAVRDLVDESHEEEVEFEEEEVLPEELANSVVRVMVSEDGAIDLEQKPDEIRDDEVDGIACTVYDTAEDVGMADSLEDVADPEKTEDEVLVIGNSAAKSFKKGYVTVKSGTNKKAWSAAYKKVKALIGSAKMTAAHWAIVAALAKKEEEKDKFQKKIECKLIRVIRSNKDLKEKFARHIKSDFEPEVQPEGQTETEVNQEIEETAGEANPGFEEEKPQVPAEAGEPEGVTSESGNPTEDPEKQVEREDEVALPEEKIVFVEASLANSTRRVKLVQVRSSKARKYNLYKVESERDVSALDGRVVKSGKLAYAFKNTTQGMLACCAEFVSSGKGNYKPVATKEGNIVIARGVAAPVFQNYEKIEMAKAIVSARREGIKEGMKRVSLTSGKENLEAGKQKLVASRAARRPSPDYEARKQLLQSRINERKAIESKAELQRMHEAEERQRLFQSSQMSMNEEKIALKSSNARNEDSLNKLYGLMF